MKVEFIIYSPFFKERGMSVKADWNFSHLPRGGEEISAHIIMFQNEFTYQNLLEYLTDEAKSDFNKFNDRENDLEGNFRAWIYDVIQSVNLVESIHYRPNTEDYTEIIPEIYLSDLSN